MAACIGRVNGRLALDDFPNSRPECWGGTNDAVGIGCEYSTGEARLTGRKTKSRFQWHDDKDSDPIRRSLSTLAATAGTLWANTVVRSLHICQRSSARLTTCNDDGYIMPARRPLRGHGMVGRAALVVGSCALVLGMAWLLRAKTGGTGDRMSRQRRREDGTRGLLQNQAAAVSSTVHYCGGVCSMLSARSLC